MNTKQWAVFFVAILSFDYATATFFGGYKGVPKSYDNDNSGYYGWSGGCRCNEDLTSSLDDALENLRIGLHKYKNGISIKGYNLEEYEFRDGQARGFHKFERKGPYRCSLSRDYVRVIFRIGFLRLLINYTVSLVEDILTGFLGGIGSLIGRILGKVTNLLFWIVVPDVYVTVVLNQRFGVSQGFEVEGLYLNNIDNISFLDKQVSKHQNTFRPYLRPACDHALRNVFQHKLGGAFTKHFKEVRAEKHMFYYESSTEKKSYGRGRGGEVSTSEKESNTNEYDDSYYYENEGEE